MLTICRHLFVIVLVFCCICSGVHTTTSTPVWHSPKDELGGGSAWSAGLIHYALHNRSNMKTEANGAAALRSADMLAAL
jgi:hypothetical protein